MALVGAITLCLTVGPAALTQEMPTDGSGSVPARPRSIGVALFVNISGDPADEWIGVGIAETVTGNLAQLGSVSVISPDAFVSLRSMSPGIEYERRLRLLGYQLGATWLVAGGYRRLGDQLQITARTIDVESGAVSTKATIDGAVGDLFALQDQILAALAAGIS